MRPRQLASQVLLIQIAIVAAAVLASASISFWLVSGQVTDEYEKRSLAIGHSVAAMPDVVEAFADPQPARAIQPIAEAIRKAEAASFVVVANVDGIRYSHPNPDQIGQRESMLHGIREGLLATDRDGRITLVNDEAKRLLGFDATAQGKRVSDLVPPGRMREVLSGERAGIDQMLLAGDRVLVANRMPAIVRGEAVGAVVTLRDRTELEGILRELDGVRSLAHALRAQAHEFSNKLHTVAGLIELGRADEAVRFITRTAPVHQELVDLVHERIGDPALAALLLAKAAIANERGVEFRLAGETRLPADAADARDLVTVVGNLVDNAVEAVASSGAGGWVEVAVQAGPEGVGVRVRDSGPGVGTAVAEEIFEEGFTTKTGTSHQGLGLALARQVAQRRGGWLRVSNEGGAVFTALLPADGSHAS